MGIFSLGPQAVAEATRAEMLRVGFDLQEALFPTS